MPQICMKSNRHSFALSLNAEQFNLTPRYDPTTSTPGQSEPESDGNEGVRCILQSSSSFGEGYPFAEMQ